MTDAPSDTAQLRDWLRQQVAFYLEIAPDQIAPDTLLVELGMDSLYAVALATEIEKEFGLPVDPMVAWDHPTVTALADHLIRRLAEEYYAASDES